MLRFSRNNAHSIALHPLIRMPMDHVCPVPPALSLCMERWCRVPGIYSRANLFLSSTDSCDCRKIFFRSEMWVCSGASNSAGTLLPVQKKMNF